MDDAAGWLFAGFGFHAYEDLVVKSGWPVEKAIEKTLEMMHAVLIK